MNKRFALWGGFAVAMAMVIFLMVRFADEDSSVSDTNAAEVQAPVNTDLLEIREDDWYKGNPDADVIIVKYSDFQCPACRFIASMDDQLSGELGEEVLFVFRHFPLRNFEFSQMAARYAEAAGRQGLFWRMHDLIYINQQRWSRGNAEEIFRQFAESMELDMEQFEEDLQDPEIVSKIESDFESGRSAGVRSVPSVYINGEKITNPRSVDAYRSLIESRL
ncbi:MAG: thioredoxin domain-containing protein [Balneolales bacterium]